MATAFAILGSGCIFSPDKGDKPKVVVDPYPPLDNPQHVLEAYQIAYQHPDSMKAHELYDADYLGTSEDPNNTATKVTFTRLDEIAHINALQRSTTITSIVLELGPTSTWTRLSSDDPSHPEWAQIQIPSWRIDIFDATTEYIAQSANPITFSFAPTAAGADTTWKIIRWHETLTSGA